ncbi:MAG: hypothetical protein QOG04_254 [Actinomycetota bacterium]|nr:hypothetical protein [Actinomycetota bacterium]
MSEQVQTTERTTNGKAIGSVIMGVIGVTGFPFVASIVAIVLGHMARDEMKTDGKQGHGLALTGIILGWIGVIVLLVLIFVFGWFVTWAKVSN